MTNDEYTLIGSLAIGLQDALRLLGQTAKDMPSAFETIEEAKARCERHRQSQENPYMKEAGL